MKKVLIYKAYDRFWHWMQAIMIIILAVTGFEIHSSLNFFGLETAVNLHNFIALLYVVLIIFTIFWHFATGEWRHYVPTSKNLNAQVMFYLFGIFRNAPHPFKKTLISKLNPIQRLVYFALKIIVIPLMVVTGLLYLLFRQSWGGVMKSLDFVDLSVVAYIHTAGAFALIAFLVVHLYLITTGHKVFTNLEAMITGYEEIEDDELAKENSNQAGYFTSL